MRSQQKQAMQKQRSYNLLDIFSQSMTLRSFPIETSVDLTEDIAKTERVPVDERKDERAREKKEKRKQKKRQDRYRRRQERDRLREIEFKRQFFGYTTPTLKEDEEEFDEVSSWREVFGSCCCHSAKEWLNILALLVPILVFFYFLMVSLQILSISAKVLSGCQVGKLFNGGENPLVVVAQGVLVTALLQSSSTTIGLMMAIVQTGSVSVRQGIYFIMGANIGTAVTSSISSLAQYRSRDLFERAFAGASLQGLFNLFTAAVLLPLEVYTGYLSLLTESLVSGAETNSSREKWEGPVKRLVSPLAKRLIVANKGLISDVSRGAVCESFYPTECEDGEPTYDTCRRVGMLACDSSSNRCPWFFKVNATRGDDIIAGWVCLVLSLVLLFFCVLGISYSLQRILRGFSTRVVHKVTDINGYASVAIGSAGTAVLLQSSSAVTALLTPLMGIGVLRLEQTYPLTLGANIGTTLGAIATARSMTGTKALQVAMAHVFFNATGFLIFYPLPFMRRFPTGAAKALGKSVRCWRPFSFVFIIFVWYLLPGCIISIPSFLSEEGVQKNAIGIPLAIILATLVPSAIVWWFCFNDATKCSAVVTCSKQQAGNDYDAAVPSALPEAQIEPGLTQSSSASDIEAQNRATLHDHLKTMMADR